MITWLSGYALGVLLMTLAWTWSNRPTTTTTTCWPAREADDDCVRCGDCDALWTTDRVCPKAVTQ